MKKIKIIYIIVIMMFSMSCESYLDKSDESSITDKDLFTNFNDFQGFVEEMYGCITDWNKGGAPNPYLFADEVLNNHDSQFDRGNYWTSYNLFYGPNASASSSEPRNKRMWPLLWYGIRKANITIEKVDEYFQYASQEEQDIIKGQALFFRGYFHFELMRWWGGMPYIDTVLSPSQNLNLPRLTFQEAAIKAAKDLREAADLLPLDWDDTLTGQRTLGKNQERIGKMHALGFLGKVLLYAASPMMNEEATGNNTYNAELCKQAADALAEGLRICDETGRFKLNTWDKWEENFWILSYTEPSGGTERIMKAPHYNPGRVSASTYESTVWREMGSTNDTEVPTHNYVKNYAMANGLPIDHPDSGYDEGFPWKNREPRFYKDIIVDGDMVVYTTPDPIVDKYVQLFNGGRHRAGTWGSVTGYFYKRYTPIGTNKWDLYRPNLQSYVPFLRLADLYMEYAEAVLHGYGSPSSSAPGYSLTAVDAVNKIRNRAQLPNLVPEYTSNKDKFMNEIIRERAVEFAFNVHRFCDLRRWNLNHHPDYRDKTAIDFDRDADGNPINVRERVVISRVATKKHNWLPLPNVEDTRLYPEFPQNPGW